MTNPNSRSLGRPTTEPTSRRRPRTQPDIRCTGCDERVVEIDMIVDGHQLTMRSCTHCDRRAWARDGRSIELRDVLAGLTVSPTRYRRDMSLV